MCTIHGHHTPEYDMPVDRGAIDGQLREIGEGERWWELREFRDLPHVLGADERIRALVGGKLIGSRRPRLLPSAPWLIVATSERLVFLKMERFGRQQVDVRLEQVTGMRHVGRLRAVQVTIETRQGRYRIRIPKGDAFRFIGALTPLLQRPGDAGLDAAAAEALLARPAGLLARLTAPPPPDYVARAELARVEAVVERLEGEVERLRQHVEFLENLLQEHPGGALSLPRSPADS